MHRTFNQAIEAAKENGHEMEVQPVNGLAHIRSAVCKNVGCDTKVTEAFGVATAKGVDEICIGACATNTHILKKLAEGL